MTKKEPTNQDVLSGLIGKMEAATTDGDVSGLTQDDIGGIYLWLMWAMDTVTGGRG